RDGRAEDQAQSVEPVPPRGRQDRERPGPGGRGAVSPAARPSRSHWLLGPCQAPGGRNDGDDPAAGGLRVALRREREDDGPRKIHGFARRDAWHLPGEGCRQGLRGRRLEAVNLPWAVVFALAILPTTRRNWLD